MTTNTDYLDSIATAVHHLQTLAEKLDDKDCEVLTLDLRCVDKDIWSIVDVARELNPRTS